jgi:predicted naringenin-chalcone synthase
MKNAGVILTDFKVHLPRFHNSQNQIVQWTQECHEESEKFSKTPSAVPIAKFFKRYAVKENQIAQRYYECPDALKHNWNEHEIYKITEDTPFGVNTSARHDFYLKKSVEAFENFYSPTCEKPDHIIHVTCTGYVSPSAPQILVARTEWEKPTEVTHAYHMGCYAAMPAIRLAQALAHQQPVVDIVHNELCGLHMNPGDHTPEQIVVQSLFADGHIKYSARAFSKDLRGFHIQGILEKLIPHSGEDMSWVPSPWGMKMTLSRSVPEKVKENIKPFLEELAEKSSKNLDMLLKNAIFAIHPGGPKIISEIQEALNLTDDQVKFSKKVLSERGNMSSATLPHVWNEILLSAPPKQTPIVSLAFGPGLTIFGAVLEFV